MDASVLGIDIGTSAVKAVCVNQAGSLVASAVARYPTHYPGGAAQEQYPEDWVRAVGEAVSGLGRPFSVVAAIGLTGNMSALVLTDGTGVPVRPAMLLADGRAHEVLPEFSSVAGLIRAAAAVDPAAVFLLPKLLWVRRFDPGAFAAAHRVMGSKDYVRMALTGEWASDASDMGNSLCLDLATLEWVPEVLDGLGISPDLWPSLKRSNAVTGRLLQKSADVLGLTAGIPVVTGAADVAAALLGAGVKDGRHLLVVTGTSMPAVRILAEWPKEGHGLTYHPTADGRVYAMASALGAGASFAWWADLLGVDVAGLEKLASEVCGFGPIWLPFLSGRGSPDFVPAASGSLHGLRAGHNRADIALAVYQGVACHIIEAAGQLLDDDLDGLVLGGGGVSPLLGQQLSGLSGLPVWLVREGAVSAYGAAMLAAEGAWGDGATKAWALPRVKIVVRDPPADGAYRALLERFADLVQHSRATWRSEEVKT